MHSHSIELALGDAHNLVTRLDHIQAEKSTKIAALRLNSLLALVGLVGSADLHLD